MATTFNLEVLFRAIDQLSVPMAKMQKKLNDFSDEAKKIGDSVSKVGRKMTTFVTLPILGLGTAMVRTSATFEQYQASFETLLGSQEKGKELFDEITQMAAKTPFELGDLAESSRMLLNFGIEAEKIIPNLQMLGDIAGADKNKLHSLTLAFSQMSSTGRLMGQDLLQMVNAGFNPLQIISEQTGRTMGQLKKDMEDGAISTEMVTKAFRIATSKGGRFYKNMDKQSKTFFGKWSTMMDNLKLMLKSFGDVLLPIAIKVVEKITKWAAWLEKLNPKVKKTIIIILALVAAIGPLVFIIGKLISAVGAIGKAFQILRLIFSPQGAAIILMAALIIAIIIIIKNWGKITLWMTDKWKKLTDWIQRMPRIILILLKIFTPLIWLPILIIRNWSRIKTVFSNLWISIRNIFAISINFITNIFQGMIEWVIEKLRGWGIIKFFDNLWQGIVGAFIIAIDKIKELWNAFTGWAMKNPVLKWLFETKPGKKENEKKNDIKKKEEELKKEESKKDKKNLFNMDSMFKNFKDTKNEQSLVYVNVKVSSDEGSTATIEQVGSSKNIKKKIQSDSNYTGNSFPK